LLLFREGRVHDLAPTVVEVVHQEIRRTLHGALTDRVVVRALVQLVKGAHGGLPADAAVTQAHVEQFLTGVGVEARAALRTQARLHGRKAMEQAFLPPHPHAVGFIEGRASLADVDGLRRRRGPPTGVSPQDHVH